MQQEVIGVVLADHEWRVAPFRAVEMVNTGRLRQRLAESSFRSQAMNLPLLPVHHHGRVVALPRTAGVVAVDKPERLTSYLAPPTARARRQRRRLTTAAFAKMRRHRRASQSAIAKDCR